MQQLVITGASDDLIEVDGAISEEWPARGIGRDLLAVSDGTLLSITYTRDGTWAIAVLRGGTARIDLTSANVGPGGSYSDRAVLTADSFAWVALATEWAKP